MSGNGGKVKLPVKESALKSKPAVVDKSSKKNQTSISRPVKAVVKQKSPRAISKAPKKISVRKLEKPEKAKKFTKEMSSKDTLKNSNPDIEGSVKSDQSKGFVVDEMEKIVGKLEKGRFEGKMELNSSIPKPYSNDAFWWSSDVYLVVSDDKKVYSTLRIDTPSTIFQKLSQIFRLASSGIVINLELAKKAMTTMSRISPAFEKHKKFAFLSELLFPTETKTCDINHLLEENSHEISDDDIESHKNLDISKSFMESIFNQPLMPTKQISDSLSTPKSDLKDRGAAIGKFIEELNMLGSIKKFRTENTNTATKKEENLYKVTAANALQEEQFGAKFVVTPVKKSANVEGAITKEELSRLDDVLYIPNEALSGPSLAEEELGRESKYLLYTPSKAIKYN